MRRRNEVDVVATARLKFEHHFGEALMCDFVFDLLFVRLRDLIVLTIDTAQIAVAEEDVAGAARAGKGRFFSEVRGVGRNDRQPARVARSNLVLEPVVQTITRTDRATCEQCFERFDTMPQLATLQEAKV